VSALTCVEICAGAGGTALGLEAAGFSTNALVELDADCCQTLKDNRPHWQVHRADITAADARLTGPPPGLLSAGLPCTPHSRGGKQLGEADERHLWRAALRIVAGGRPRAVMFETSDAVMSPLFDIERTATVARLREAGFFVRWEVLDAADYGVPQHRKRAILVAFGELEAARAFRWPDPYLAGPVTAGEALHERMSANGWPGADAWRDAANGLAPTIVGGSHKHGGPDLGPSQSKQAWRKLGIDPMGIADDVPGPDGRYERSEGKLADAAIAGPMLTVRCGALLQGFPDDWAFHGGKTSRWRQIGNAFPPPVARAVGTSIRTALEAVR
jgi:DNA (cytosine-5)-methyltransferase 1